MRSAALALVLLLPPMMTAHAQESTELAISPAARERWDRGVRMLDVQNYAEAIAEFQAGYEIDPNPLFLYNLALAYRKSGQCEKAIETYRTFLRTHPLAKLEGHAQQGMRECQASLDAQRRAAAAQVAAPQPVAPAAPAPPPVTVPPRPWYRDTTGDAFCIGGVVGLAAGTVLWRLGRSGIEDVSAAPTYGDFRDRARDAGTADTEQTVGVVTMAVGGALLVGGVLHYALARRIQKWEPLILSGTLGPHGGLVLAGMRF